MALSLDKTWRERKGFTLIELMVALSIVMGVAVFALVGMTTMVRESRMTKMRITAASMLRAQGEEVYAVAADVSQSGSIASQVVAYYANTFDTPDEHLPLGADRAVVPRVELVDNAKLVYLFPIRNLGGRIRDGNGEFAINHAALGKVTFYLDETAVFPTDGADAIWKDLGVQENAQSSGFDMNRDGQITPLDTVLSMNMMKSGIDALGIEQMPVDIEVTVYNDEMRRSRAFSLKRRLILTDSRDLSYMLDP